MENFITFLYEAIQSPYFLFIVLCISTAIKIHYIGRLAPKIIHKRLSIFPLWFLFISIISAIVCDISWFVKLIQVLFIPMPYYIVVFFIRLAWAFLVIQYYSLSLFLESLTNAQFMLKKTHLPIAIITALFSGYFFFLAFFQPLTLATEAERDVARETMNSIEFFVMRHIVVYLIGIFAVVGLYRAYQNIKNKQLPKILRQQLHLFTWFLIIPYLAVEFVLGLSFKLIHEMYFIISVSTLLLSVAIYYCLHRVLKLRFMNTTPRVQDQQKPYVIDHFKTVLEQLSNATNMEELLHICQAFFKEAFSIPTQSMSLTIRDQNIHEDPQDTSQKRKQIEAFVNQPVDDTCSNTYQSIFVYDEIAFNNFYEETNAGKLILQFLETINASIFLPIYSKKNIVAYMIVEKNARNECFSHAEQNAMVVFAGYLGSIINLLHHKNLNSLLSKEKKIKDQIFIKHQEINHYKESVHAFLRRSKEKSLGIVFYKNGRFTNGNQDAEKIIHINLNVQEGHPLTQAFKYVAQHVQAYKGPYNHYTKDGHGHPLILSGVPHLKQECVIITVSYPEISDVIMQQMHLLHNPNDWDYLLYLASTNAGALISKLIPSSGETLLNIKINLLKATFNKKTLLLDVPDHDLDAIVQLIHTISLREALHTIELTEPVHAPDNAATLFGDTIVNPDHEPLLKTLNKGTLFIKNVHFLDKTTQHYLLEYITYGLYRIYNTDQKRPSNARIICSTHQNIANLIQAGSFSAELFKLLKRATVKIPSLLTIPQHELHNLIDGYTDQIITSHAMKNLFALSEKEKQKIIEQPPSSLRELRSRVEQLILNKSEESTLDLVQSLHGIDDPDLMEAARLGKQALKQPDLMRKLWEKFKNQNKIALFLGVNRSSVNRRIKLYDIGNESQGVA